MFSFPISFRVIGRFSSSLYLFDFGMTYTNSKYLTRQMFTLLDHMVSSADLVGVGSRPCVLGFCNIYVYDLGDDVSQILLIFLYYKI